MAGISIATTARLSPSLRIDPSNPVVQKILSRLSRPSLLSLALDWLDHKNQSLSIPYLLRDDGADDDSDDFYPPAQSLEELQELYADMQDRKGPRREVVERILEGDWRHGVSLYQLAMADLQYLYDHPTSQKWSAYRIVSLKTPSTDIDADEPARVDKESLQVPRFHPSTFLRNLQAQILPDVKAHCNFDRHKQLPLLLLRIFILDSPYNTDLAASSSGGDQMPTNFDSSRTVYIAFPDASPHVYISKSQALGAPAVGESKSLRTLMVEGIPKALSRSRERYTLKSTSLTTRNLQELVHRRGSGRTNTAGGGWSIYSDERKKESPLDTVLPSPPLSEQDEEDTASAINKVRKRAASPDTERDRRVSKRRMLVAEARFGASATPNDKLGVERVDIIIEDPLPNAQAQGDGEPEEGEQGAEAHASLTKGRLRLGSRGIMGQDRGREASTREENPSVDDGTDERRFTMDWKPTVRMTFHGSHVFAGIRQLVEHGIIDGERMPGWMTGEEGVTVGIVRSGRIRGHRGSGV